MFLTRLPTADIEPDLTAQDRERVNREIQKELSTSSPDHMRTLHPSIPQLPSPQFSELIEQEVARKAARIPLENGVDLSRYEALEPPSTDSTSDEARPQVLQQWREILQKAYASSTHLQTRLTNLALLEEFGKNAWLIGNAQLEDILRALERELVTVRQESEDVNKARKAGQENVRGELEALDQSWRRGVGKVIEVEVAAERVRQDILEHRREMARRAV